MSPLLADLVLLIHFLFVLFVVGGFALVCAGAAAGWRWVRNWWFRIAHCAAIALVAAESLVGVMCPLTVWEDALRNRAADAGFVQRWLHRILFYSFPEWVFTAAYVLFALVVALTFWLVPPLRSKEKRR